MSQTAPLAERPPAPTVLIAPEERARAVLVHGAWHGAWCWLDGFAQRLVAAGVTCIVPDLPGHGARRDEGDRVLRRVRGPRMATYAADVRAVVEDLAATLPPGPAPVLVGHSMGGGVVQHVLADAERPDLAGAVLLASMPPSGVWRVTLDVLRRHPGRFVAANATRDLGRLVADPAEVRHLFLSADAPEASVAALASRLQGESYVAFLDMLALDLPRARPGDVPVRVLGAAEDTIFGPAQVRATARAWGSGAVIVPDLAHDVMLDRGWEQVADRVAGWAHEMSR